MDSAHRFFFSAASDDDESSLSADSDVEQEDDEQLIPPPPMEVAVSFATELTGTAGSRLKRKRAEHTEPYELTGDFKVVEHLVTRLPSQTTAGHVNWALNRGVIMCSEYNTTGNFLALGLAGGYVYVYEQGQNTPQYSVHEQETYGSAVTAVRFVRYHHTEILLATYTDLTGMVKYWQYTSGKCLATIRENRQIFNMALNSDNSRLLTVGDQPREDSAIYLRAIVFVYDFLTKQLILRCAPSDTIDVMDGHRFNIYAAKYHPVQQHLFLTGGWDNVIHLWDDRHKNSMGRIPTATEKATGPHICGDALDIDAEHEHVLTGSWRTTEYLQVWDLKTRRFVTDINLGRYFSSQLYAARWMGKKYMLVGGSNANMAAVVDRSSTAVVAALSNLPHGVYTTALCEQFSQVAICSGDKAYMCRFTKEKPFE